MCTGVFGKRDVGRIEREFLDVLDFELSITEDDVMSHYDAIMSLVAPSRVHSNFVSPVPELSYTSSPSSTAASLSPRTPSTLVDSSMEELHTKSGLSPNQTQYVQSHVSQPKKSSHGSSTLRILRSFPFSRPFGHSSSSSSSTSSRSESQAHSQGVAQQGRCPLLPPFAAQAPSQVYA